MAKTMTTVPSGLDTSCFLPVILRAAREIARECFIQEEHDTAVIVHPSLAAVIIRQSAPKYDRAANVHGKLKNELAQCNMSKFEGIDIFDGVFVDYHKLILEIGDEFLSIFSVNASKGYKHSLPECVTIPMSGTAPSCEASAYLRSRLYAYSLQNTECRRTQDSANALFRCLCLFSLSGDELIRMHSSAVRAAMKACESCALGSVDSAAMAAALLHAEGPRKNK